MTTGATMTDRPTPGARARYRPPMTPDELDEMTRGWRAESLAALDRARKLVKTETARAIINYTHTETADIIGPDGKKVRL